MRLLLTFILLLTLFFSACIGLIRAQPYDDSELRTFLAPPDGCPRPCFMGIRPGVTRAEEATAILEAHEWINTVSRYEATEDVGIVSLTATWSGRQPDFIDSSVALWLSVRDNSIQMISIPTRIPLGQIFLQLGIPQYGEVAVNPIPEPPSTSSGYYALYHDGKTVFFAFDFCNP
jgi:hypothetical protein